MRNIIDILLEAGTFRMFVSASQATDVVDILRTDGPFTVFAPDDEAFTKLPKGTYDDLLKNTPQLKAVLMYHVVAGKYALNEISKMESAKTIQGQEVKIDAHQWHLHVNPKINGASISNHNIEAGNGMIHLIDRVLMPNMELTCPVCGMGFIAMEDLDAHTKMGHVVEKAPEPMPPAETMPVAEMATEPMSDMSPQETHVRGAEPNQIHCPVCGKTFKTNSEMERHMDSMHHETKGHN
jgi:uncharacterized C2H2 Zn-finger protein